MLVWWEALTALQRFFVLLAMPATLLLFLQTALLLMGLGGEGDSDADLDADGELELDLDADGDLDFGLDIDGDGVPDLPEPVDTPGHVHDADCVHAAGPGEGYDHSLRLFTLRTLVAFFAVFGWTGVVLSKGGMVEWLACVLAFLAGGIAMLLLAWLVKFALDLQSEGNLAPQNAIGQPGTVYLTIPARRAGTGKVTLLLQGRLVELDAQTDSETPLVTGTAVLVRAASEDFVLTVESLVSQTEIGGTSP